MSEHSQYDPQAVEDDGGARGQYMTLKDWRIILVGLVVLGIILFPIYQIGKSKSEKAQCVGNFKAMFTAMSLYAKDHDDGLPPIYRAETNGLPSLGDTDLIYTWHSDLRPYMSPRQTFVCPTATSAESATVEDPESSKLSIRTTYGFYAPYSAAKVFNIESPDTTILLAETSNRGSADSYDPKPFNSDEGDELPDGVAIGFDNDNFYPTKHSRSVTRLAFRGSSAGSFENARGRHEEGIHALTATGELRILVPKDAVLARGKDGPIGNWISPVRTLAQ
jgi:hypothetical protein